MTGVTLPAAARRSRAARLVGALRQARSGLTGRALLAQAIAAAALVLLLAGAVPVGQLLGWSLAFALVWLLQLAALRQRRRAARRPAAARGRHRHAAALAGSAVWGLAVCLFYGPGGPLVDSALLVTALAIGALPLLAAPWPHPASAVALCVLPALLRVAVPASHEALALALLLALVTGLVWWLGSAQRRSLDHAVAVRVRAERLVAQLRRRHAASEAARRQAEAASLAKTRFFAAASHDLRQPLQALVLFTQALSTRTPREAESAPLVEQIDRSVQALDALFGELLDLTSIEAGGVRAQPRDLQLDTLFQRLKLQYAPTAFDKGLALGFRGGRHAVHADPVLLDRIVRNLVSNAIRYTADGGVLVSARRRGERVRLQVWDTGIGIAPQDQQRVFEEFHQVRTAAAPPPAAAGAHKPLGLGLAIVRRMAQVMDAPLTLHSTPGRGTVVAIELPLAIAPVEAVAPAGWPGIGITLAGRGIAVIGPPTVVREGLLALLRSWGAAVDPLDGIEALRAWAALTGPAPDLAIVDARADGCGAALALLQRQFDAPVPVILLQPHETGGAQADVEADADAAPAPGALGADVHPLAMPLAPNKLRALSRAPSGRGPQAFSASRPGLPSAPSTACATLATATLTSSASRPV